MVGNLAAGYPDVRGLMNKTKYIIGGIKMKKRIFLSSFCRIVVIVATLRPLSPILFAR